MNIQILERILETQKIQFIQSKKKISIIKG